MAPLLATATGVPAAEYRGELRDLWTSLCECCSRNNDTTTKKKKDRDKVREILASRSPNVFGEEQVDLHQWIAPLNYLDALLAEALAEHPLLLIEPSPETKVVAKVATRPEDVASVSDDVWDLVTHILRFYSDFLKFASGKSLFSSCAAEVVELLAASRDDVALLALETIQHFATPPLTKAPPDSATATSSGVTLPNGGGRLLALAIQPAPAVPVTDDVTMVMDGSTTNAAADTPAVNFAYHVEQSEDVSRLTLTEGDLALVDATDHDWHGSGTTSRKKRRRAGSTSSASASPTDGDGEVNRLLRTTADVFFVAKERAPAVPASALFVLLCHIRFARFDLAERGVGPTGISSTASTWRLRATLALLNTAGVETMSAFVSAQTSPEWYGSITQVLKDMVADLSEAGHGARAGEDGISLLSSDSSPPSFETKLLAVHCLAALVSRRDSTRLSLVLQDLGVSKSQTFGVLPTLLRFALAAMVGPATSVTQTEGSQDENHHSEDPDAMDIGVAFLEGTVPDLPPRQVQVARALALTEALLALTASVIITPSGTASLVDAGLIPALLAVIAAKDVLEKLSCPSTPLLEAHLCFVTAQAVQILDSAIVTHNQALSAFLDLEGVSVLTTRVAQEVKAVESVDDITPAQRILLFSLVTCLTVVFHQDANNLGGTTLRQPELSQTLIHLLEHTGLYGGHLAALLATLLSDTMNSDPHIVHFMHKSGIGQAFLRMIGSGTDVQLPEVPELVMVVPNVLAALALTADGATAVATYNPFPTLLRVFYHPRYAMPQSRCLLSEMTSIVGTALDEICRHVDLLKPLVCQALVTTVSNVVELAEDLGRREAASVQITPELETERTCLIQYVLNLGQLLEQVLQNEELCDIFVEKGGLTSLLRLFPASLIDGGQFLAHVSCLSAPSVSTLHHATIEETLSIALKCIQFRSNPARLLQQFFQNAMHHIEELDRCHQDLLSEGGGDSGSVLDCLPRSPLHLLESVGDSQVTATYLRRVALVQWSTDLLAVTIKIAVQRSQDSGIGWSSNEREWKQEITKDESIAILERISQFFRQSLLEVCRARTQPGFEAEEKDRCLTRSKVRYRLRIVCPEGAVVRDGVEIDSCANVGSMELGDIVEAYDRCINSSGIMRYRTDRGWVSEMTRGHGREPISEVIGVAPFDAEVESQGKRIEVAIPALRTVGVLLLARGQAVFSDLLCSLSRLSLVSLRTIPVRTLTFEPDSVGSHVARTLRFLSTTFMGALNAQGLSLRRAFSASESVSRQGSAMFLGCLFGMLHSCLFEEKRERRVVNLPLLLNLVSSDPLAHRLVNDQGSSPAPVEEVEPLGLLSASLCVLRECAADFSGRKRSRPLDSSTPPQSASRFVAASLPPVVSLLRRIVSTPLSASPVASVLSRVQWKDLPLLLGDKNLTLCCAGTISEGFFEPERFVCGLNVALSSAMRQSMSEPDFVYAPPHLLHPMVSLVGDVVVGLEDSFKRKPNQGRTIRNGFNLSDYFRRQRQEETEAEEEDEAEFQVDESAVTSLVEMGFDRDRAIDAFESTRSNRIEVAMEYALTHAPPSPATIERRRAEREERQRQRSEQQEPVVPAGASESLSASGNEDRQSEAVQPSEPMDSGEADAGKSAGKEEAPRSAKDELKAWMELAPAVCCSILVSAGELGSVSQNGKETGGNGEVEALAVVISTFLLDLCQGYPKEKVAILSKIFDALKANVSELRATSPSSASSRSLEWSVASLCHATVLITRALPNARRLVLMNNLVSAVADCLHTALIRTDLQFESSSRTPCWVAPAILFLDVMAQPIVEFTEEELMRDVKIEPTEGTASDLEIVRSDHASQRLALSSLSKNMFSVMSVSTESDQDSSDMIPAYFPLIPLKYVDSLRQVCMELLGKGSSERKPSPGVAQAAMLLLLRLLRSPTNATSFRRLGIAEAILNLPKDAKFTGNTGLVSLVFRRLLEDESTLRNSMEFEMRATVSKLQSKRVGTVGGEKSPVSLRKFMEATTPLVCRDAKSFLAACCLSVQIEVKGSDSLVTLLPVEQRAKRAAVLSDVLGDLPGEGKSPYDSEDGTNPVRGQGSSDGAKSPSKPHHKNKRKPIPKGQKKGHKVAPHHEVRAHSDSSASFHIASLLINAIVSTSVIDAISSESFLWVENLLEVLCELVSSVPSFAHAVHNFKPHRLKDKVARSALTSRLKHALSGCPSPPKSFISYVLHCVLPQDRWNIRLDHQVWDRRRGSSESEALVIKGKRERAYRITKISHASARFILSLVSRPGEGRRRVISDLSFALSGGRLGHGSGVSTPTAVATQSTSADDTLNDLNALHAWAELCLAIIAPRSTGKTLDTIAALNADNVRTSLETGLVHALLFGLHRVRLTHPMATTTCSALLLPLECLTRASVNDALRKVMEKDKETKDSKSESNDQVSLAREVLDRADRGLISTDDDEVDGDSRSGDESAEGGQSEMDEGSSSSEGESADSSGTSDSGDSMDESDSQADSSDESDSVESEEAEDMDDEAPWDGNDADDFSPDHEANDEFVDDAEIEDGTLERFEQPIEDGWHRIDSSAFGGVLGGQSLGGSRSHGAFDATAADILLRTMLQDGQINSETIQQLEGTLGIRIMSSSSRGAQGENAFAVRVLGEPMSSAGDENRRSEVVGSVPQVHQRAQPEVGYASLSSSSRVPESSSMEYVYGGPAVTGYSRNYDLISPLDPNGEDEPQHQITQIDLQLFPGGPAAVASAGVQHSLHPLLCGVELPPVSSLVLDLLPHGVRATRPAQTTSRRSGEFASSSISYGGFLMSSSTGNFIRSTRPYAVAGYGNNGFAGRHGAPPLGWTDDGLPLDASVEVFASALERAVRRTATIPDSRLSERVVVPEEGNGGIAPDPQASNPVSGDSVDMNAVESEQSSRVASEDGVTTSLAHGLRLSPESDAGAVPESLDNSTALLSETVARNAPTDESDAAEHDVQMATSEAEVPNDATDREIGEVNEVPSAESQPAVDATDEETNTNGLVCPPDVDPEVFNSLPFEMQQDCVMQYNATQELAAQLDGSSLDPEFLAALPEDMRREVIEQDRRERRLREDTESQADPSNAQEMDNASFVASLSPELREEILVTADDAFLRSLPPDILAEAQILRERASIQYHRRLQEEEPNTHDEAGPTENAVSSSARRHASQSTGSRAGASRRKARGGKIRVDRNRDDVVYRPSALPPPFGKADLMLLTRLTYLMGPIRPPRLLQKVFHNLVGNQSLRRACSSLFIYLLHGKRDLAEAAAESLTTGYSESDSWRRTIDALFTPKEFPPTSMIGSSPSFADSEVFSLSSGAMRKRQGQDAAAVVAANLNAGSTFLSLPPAVCTRLVETLLQLCKSSPGFCIHVLTDPTINSQTATGGFTCFELLLDLLDLPTFSASSTNLELLLTALENAVAPLSYIPKPGEDEMEISSKDYDAALAAGKEWVEVPRVMVSQTRLQGLCSILRNESIRDATFTKVNTIVRRLCRVESNRGYVLAELASVAGSLGDDAVADLRALRVRLEQAADHYKKTKDTTESNSAEGPVKIPASASHRLSSALTLSTTASELKLLRVLQTLQALCLENWQDASSKKIDGSVIVTDELVELLRQLEFDKLWDELSSCLSVVQVLEGVKALETGDDGQSNEDANTVDEDEGEEHNTKKKLRNTAAGLLTRFLPAIEALFVANASATRPSHHSEETITGKSEDIPLENLVGGKRVLSFVAANKVLLNALVRNNPGLLEKGFRALVQVPRCRVFLDFDVKQHWFKSQMRRLRQHASRRHGSLRLHIRRKYVFEDAYHQLRLRNADEVRGRLHITFRNEEGVDAGGLSREFFGILAKEIFNRNYALFTSTEDGCTFQPNQHSSINPDHLSYFRFVGRIVGKAVSDGFLLDAHFTRSLYKHMLGMQPTYHDMEAIDPDYYRNLKTILEYDLADLGLELNFSIEDHSFGRSQTIDLIPNGRTVHVTEENKEEYVRLVCQHRMTTAIQAQIKAYLDGFYELVPPELIAIFTPRELELLISGLPDIDVLDLKQNTEYVGWKATDKEIEWFWNVLSTLSPNEKASFLQFVTGSSKVPLSGFAELQGMRGIQKFSIHKAAGKAGALMSAHTCFNQLDLPVYSSEEEMRGKLLYAINEGGGAFLFA